MKYSIQGWPSVILVIIPWVIGIINIAAFIWKGLFG